MPTVHIEESGCRDCGLCVEICPTEVFEEEALKQMAKVVREEDCIGCTSCVYLCPSRCLTVNDTKLQRPFHHMEAHAALISRFLQQVPATEKLTQADYEEALKDTHVRLRALADALQEIMGRGQKAVGRSAGNLAATHMPEMYESSQLPSLLAGLQRRFVHAFDFQFNLDPDGTTINLVFPNCSLHKVVSQNKEVVGTANVCELFHEYLAGLLSAFTSRSYAVTTLSTVGHCTMKFQIRS